MRPFYLLIPFFSLFLPNALQGQISGIINRYCAVQAIDTCSGSLTVSDTAGFKAGDAALMIQMQGAQILTGNDAAFGTISTLNSAGLFERVELDSVGATAVFVKHQLLNSYNTSGKVQLIRIPQFKTVVIVDTLRAKPWDGSTGGVLAMEVSGSLIFQAPVTVSGAGFRGGQDYVATGNNCNWLIPINGYVFGTGNWRGAFKGEGIAQTIPGSELGRGPQSNGGGGGNDHNSGGGGGANTAMGGDGGKNDEPNLLGCSGNNPGFGGYVPALTADRWFLGGGGGAGHSNNLLKSKGGAGGGLVMLRAGVLSGVSAGIYAKGEDAGNSEGDGAGGGGAGGTIWLDISAPAPNLVLNASGGNGGNADNKNMNRCMGPGGGGAGGRILTNTGAGIFSVTGGQAGITINSTDGCNNSNNGAEAGNLGQIQALSALPQGTVALMLPKVLLEPQTDTICLGEDAIFAVVTNAGNWNFQWQVNKGSGWEDLTSGGEFTGFLTDHLVVLNPQPDQSAWSFRCRVFRPGCAAIFSAEVHMFIGASPTADFIFSLNGLTANFTNNSSQSTAYFWDFGDGITSILSNPLHIYAQEGSFTVRLYAISACDTAIFEQSISTLLAPEAGFMVPVYISACSQAAVVFENQSSANAESFFWSFPGGTPDVSSAVNPSINYTLSGIYTAQLIASNPLASDTLEQIFEVEIFDLPLANFNWLIQSNGQVQFSNQSQNGTAYTWDFGDGSPQQSAFDTQHTYTTSGAYIVTLIVSNPCGASILQQEVSIQIVGSKSPDGIGKVLIYPNPSTDWLTLEWSKAASQPIDIQVLDAFGHLVLPSLHPDKEYQNISMNGWPAGVYQVQIRFKQGVVSQAVIKIEDQ